LYNALSHRSKQIEQEIGAVQFSGRPGRTLRFLGVFKVWHDRGLALIYGSVLGAWMFPVLCGVFWLLDSSKWLPISVPAMSAVLAIVWAAVMVYELERLDRHASRVTATGDAAVDNSRALTVGK
jgi:hypothetical protein